MLHSTEIQQDALRILNAVPDNYLVLLPDEPRFTIAGVTDAYLKATLTQRDHIVGRGLFEVFPDNPNLQEVSGVQNLRASLHYVLEHKREHRMADQRYDVPDPGGDGFVYKVWRPMNRPVFNAAGDVQYIIHHVEDVTALVKAEEREVRIRGIEQAYTLFMQAPTVIGIVRGKGHVLQLANAEAFKLWGKGPEIIGKPLQEALPELENQGIIELFDRVYNTGETYIGKAVPVIFLAHEREGGHHFDVVYQPFYEEGSDSPAGVFALSYDVTQMVEAQKKAEESEARFRTMANSIPQLAWMTDEKGWIYWYNDRWYEYTGTTPEEMLGWGWTKVHHPDMVEGVVGRITAAFESGNAWEDVFLLRSKDGEYRWFLSRALPVRKDDGTLVGWFGTNTDITEQRHTEEALKKSEEQLLLAMEGGELGYFDYNPRTGELKWSARTKELFGLPPDAPVDYHTYLGALYPEDRERTHAAVQRALDPEVGGYENIYRVIGVTDGRLRWLRSKGKVFFDEQGKAYRLSGVMLDITQQKEAEEALQRSESNLRNLVLQAPVAMCIGSGPSFIVEVANDRMLELWGKRPEEIMGRPVFEVLSEAGEQGLRQVIEQVYGTGERFTANEMPVSLPRKDKVETVFVNFVYEPIKNRDGAVTKIIAVAIDVTDQVVARKEIEESHREFQFAMDFVPQMIWLAWPDGYHYYYNKQLYDYTGLTYGETKGEAWNYIIHPDDQERAWELWRHSLASGEPYEIEYRCRRYDGQYRWFLARALPLRDDTGTIIKWFGTTTDIHDQKTFAEVLEKLVEERTRELHRSNEDLQQFVHVASHDLKEPVRKINVFVSRLQGELNERLDEKTSFYLSRVQDAANRMVSMIDGVLAYATISALEEIYEPVDLNEEIKSVASDLELAIQKKGATIHYDHLPTLEGAPAMLHQVFYNLISNSLKFAKADVPPVIVITSETIDQKGKAFARIVFKDNGIGFEQKFAEKIFGTFTRLHSKDKYEGAGLGLSLCKKIVERHGGSIVAKGAENVGAAFEILLPMGK